MRVLVAGDVVTDHYIYESGTALPGSSALERVHRICESGGAGLLATLLQTLGSSRVNSRAFTVHRHITESLPTRDGFCVMGPSEREPGDSKRPDRTPVWRVRHALGLTSDASKMNLPLVGTPADEAEIAVLDDAGLGFRRWPHHSAWPAFLRLPDQAIPDWVVMKMAGPLGTGDLFHTIASGRTQEHSPRALGSLCDRTILLLSADGLRGEYVQVEGRLSWERAAIDVIRGLDANPRLEGLKAIRFVVVRLGLDGALVVEHGERERRCTLVFDPEGVEGAFLARVDGRMFGYQTCVTAAIVQELVDAGGPPLRGAPATDVTHALVAGVAAGLSAARRLALDGHGPVNVPASGFPYQRVAEEIVASEHKWRFGSAPIPPAATTSSWAIVAASASTPRTPLWGLARRVARRGVSQLTDTPFLKLAKFFSVDRSEIESLRRLERALKAYRRDSKASKPLSIAVFGPPGSGKSFGVKQLAEALFDDKNPLEFNLSQFTSPGELHGLFHQIRDRALKGEVPLVFWDEFDSRELFWLQYLLAPMQDGTFQDGQITHPIGKCVFVFAGGTRHRFEDFTRPTPTLWDPKAIQQWHDDFRIKKGPDFVSRLAGYLNVFGPNPTGSDDVTYPVRRALLLRVHLGLRPKEYTTIDPGLVEAFLRAPTYRHGARSLEKIAEQVRLSSTGARFTRSDLPPRTEIDLHVDADAFLEILEEFTRLDIDGIAALIHEYYRKAYPAAGYEPYDNLPEVMKVDNRDAASRLEGVLAMAGLRLEPRAGADWTKTDQDAIRRSIEENVSLLDEAEHDGWVASRLRNGWKLGAEKNPDTREHHLLVPYAELPQQIRRRLAALRKTKPEDIPDQDVADELRSERKKDGNSVRSYVDIIAGTDYRIVQER